MSILDISSYIKHLPQEKHFFAKEKKKIIKALRDPNITPRELTLFRKKIKSWNHLYTSWIQIAELKMLYDSLLNKFELNELAGIKSQVSKIKSKSTRIHDKLLILMDHYIAQKHKYTLI